MLYLFDYMAKVNKFPNMFPYIEETCNELRQIKKSFPNMIPHKVLNIRCYICTYLALFSFSSLFDFSNIRYCSSTLSFINGVRGAGTDLYKIFIMKKFLFFLAVTACLVTTGCSDEYDDSVLTERIEALENRMKELEELCKRLNENDYITSVEPVIENGKTVGYELSFGKSDPITIYHGKDGADSAITEVTQDEQNVYLTLQDGTVITLPKRSRPVVAATGIIAARAAIVAMTVITATGVKRQIRRRPPSKFRRPAGWIWRWRMPICYGSKRFGCRDF